MAAPAFISQERLWWARWVPASAHSQAPGASADRQYSLSRGYGFESVFLLYSGLCPEPRLGRSRGPAAPLAFPAGGLGAPLLFLSVVGGLRQLRLALASRGDGNGGGSSR